MGRLPEPARVALDRVDGDDRILEPDREATQRLFELVKNQLGYY